MEQNRKVKAGYTTRNNVGVMITYLISIAFVVTGFVLLGLSQESNIIGFSVFFICGGIASVIACYLFQTSQGEKYRLLAGSLGTFFGLFVGGILILIKN